MTNPMDEPGDLTLPQLFDMFNQTVSDDRTQGARELFEIYRSYVDAGFNEEQAWTVFVLFLDHALHEG